MTGLAAYGTAPDSARRSGLNPAAVAFSSGVSSLGGWAGDFEKFGEKFGLAPELSALLIGLFRKVNAGPTVLVGELAPARA